MRGLSYSWKRACGVSGMKCRISRKTGMPTTRYGRQRKAGAAMGCCIPMILVILFSIAIAIIIVNLI